MKRLSLMLFMAGCLSASPIVNVTFEGTSGVSNGTDDVLPYFISINGGSTIAADCYSFFNTVSAGETWMANVDTLAQAAATGEFSSQPGALAGYELIGVLATLAAVTNLNDIDLQQDIWNVFDPGHFTADAGMTAYLATANVDLPAFNFSEVEFLEPVAGTSVQPFVLLVPTPEPASLLLIGAGFAVLLRRKWQSW